MKMRWDPYWPIGGIAKTMPKIEEYLDLQVSCPRSRLLPTERLRGALYPNNRLLDSRKPHELSSTVRLSIQLAVNPPKRFYCCDARCS